MTETTEIVKPDYGTMEPPDADALAKAFAAVLDGEQLPQATDPEIVSRAIMERILKADTFEEAFRPQELESWAGDYLDVPVFVREFHLNPSRFDEESGSSVYAVVDLALATDGEVVTVSVGGRNVLSQLLKMYEQGWMDRPYKLIAKETNEPGRKVLWLVPAARPA